MTKMKTKSFLLFSTSVFAISIFLIVFHSQPPESIQNIVTQTHQHIKDFQVVEEGALLLHNIYKYLFCFVMLHPLYCNACYHTGYITQAFLDEVSLSQEKLRDVEERHLVQEERYLQLLGLGGTGGPNASTPALVTYARGDDHALAVSFVRAGARLPYTVLIYNLGLKPYSLAVVSNYCNSSKCSIVDFDLDAFPSHVSDESIYAFRPIIIQHALNRVGGVIFCEPTERWTGSSGELDALWARAAREGRGVGVLAWPRRAAVTSLTHPRMFRYFHANIDDFLFVQMLDVSRLLLAARPGLSDVMRPWIQCALTLDCIMPIGAQSGGCRFDKKPQYRYSGCHGQDASALSIVLGLRAGFEEAAYTLRGARAWRREPPAAARALLLALERNATADPPPDDRTDRTDRAEPLTHHAPLVPAAPAA